MAKIRHIAIFTEDARKLASFYVDVFGMKISQEAQGSPGSGTGFAVFITDGYIDMALIEPADPKSRKGVNHFGFTVEPSERKEIFERLKKHGIEPRKPPPDRPYIEDAVFDVSGNKIDISTTGLRAPTDKVPA
jgi:catechol 2,3-dioxygenase-like lactoylglutathione lyase family enzyme